MALIAILAVNIIIALVFPKPKGVSQDAWTRAVIAAMFIATLVAFPPH